MTYTRRQTLKLGSLALATAAIPQFSHAAAPKALIVAVPQSPLALEPVMRNNTSTLQTIYSVYDRLLRIDLATGKLNPGLATSWKKIDALTHEFSLRPDVKFHDGSAMTASDVVFSFSKTRTAGPKEGVSVAGQYQRTIASVVAVNPMTVRIATIDPDPAILLKLAGWTTEVVSQKAFEAAGGWEGWAKKPIGTGPYRIVENRQDELLVLEAHAGYWGGVPPFSRIEFRVVPEAVVRANGLIAGDFHIATLLSPDQVDQINGNKDLESAGGAIQNIRTLNFATASGVLSSLQLRQAISHAIDRTALVESVWEGRTSVPSGFQDPAFGDLFLSDVNVPAYDPELARSLIKKSGYKNEPIAYRAQTSAYPLELQTSQIIVEMLREVGLNVQLEIKENWDQVYQKPFQSVIWNESTLFAWPDPSGGLIRLYGASGQFQRDPFSWKDETFNKLAAQFQTTEDASTRKNLSKQLIQIVQTDNPPCTPLFYNALFYGKRKDIAWAPYPSLYADFGPSNTATKS